MFSQLKMNKHMTADAIEITNLTKFYGKLKALDSVSLNVKRGEFFALLGPNGAGKSTMINIICSLVKKTEGQVKIYGNDMDNELSLAKSHIGVVPQEFNFSIFETPMQILIYQAGYYGIPRKIAIPRAKKYLKLLQLWEKRNVQARKLSGGMKRRMIIARALMHEPEVLILDEPTAGVDIEIRHSMWEFLKKLNSEEKKTIILTTHYLEEAENLCKRVAIINHGKIIECAPMRSIVKKLDASIFVVECEDKITEAQIKFKDFKTEKLDAESFEITVPNTATLNDVFKLMDGKKIKVTDIRNKTNKLEQLFLRLTA